jgi:hypothetical protein
MRTYGLQIGAQFGRLTVIRRAENTPAHATRWECLCGCGNSVIVRRAALVSGMTRSCGCLQSDVAADTLRQVLTKHGYSGTRIYGIWRTMVQRCTNPNSQDWYRYGGRGIAVCDSWRNFVNFLADMGECPNGFSIDRYPDNNGNYEPGNCRWASLEEQASNTSRNHWITFQGETLTLAQWARRFNISASTLIARIARKGEFNALSYGRKKA